jgi:hypothetical protein
MGQQGAGPALRGDPDRQPPALTLYRVSSSPGANRDGSMAGCSNAGNRKGRGICDGSPPPRRGASTVLHRCHAAPGPLLWRTLLRHAGRREAMANVLPATGFTTRWPNWQRSLGGEFSGCDADPCITRGEFIHTAEAGAREICNIPRAAAGSSCTVSASDPASRIISGFLPEGGQRRVTPATWKKKASARWRNALDRERISR